MDLVDIDQKVTKVKGDFSFNFLQSYIRGYYSIILAAFAAFSITFSLLYFTDEYDVIGYSMLMAGGSAASIVMLLCLSVFFIYHDLLTFLRKHFIRRNRCSLVFNKKLRFHKFCGYLLILYSIVHILSHLCGTYIRLTQISSEEFDSISISASTLKKDQSYLELIFTTTTSITGIILAVLLLIISITSIA